MKQLTNVSTRALPLADGTILAAAGTKGSQRLVEAVDEKDQRLIDRGFINVGDNVEVVQASQSSAAVPAPVPAQPVETETRRRGKETTDREERS